MSSCPETDGHTVSAVTQGTAASLTIDEERTCVRCGAPEWHCMCEPVGPDGHWWVAPSVGANNTEWTVCMKCGNVKRNDGKPSSTCRGPVKVALR